MSMDNKVPEIRFKGFGGEWDKEILGELVKLENGFAFQSKYFKKTPTEVIVLTPGSVNIGGGFQAGKGQYYDEKQEVSSKYVFKPGDMFITMTDLTPTAQALGFPAIIPKDESKYLHNQRLGKLVGFNGDLAFLYSLLCTMKKQKEVVSTSSGTTVKHTSPDKFLNRICLFPNKEEQTQIGNYFQKLDTLINQHQQKHDKLSSIKKAMLGKMFPKPGETIPEIRFKGFSGEWNEIELGEEVTFINGRAYSQEELQDKGKYTVLRVGNFYTNSSWYYSDMELGDKYYADYGDLLYTWSASFGPHIWSGDKVIYHYHIWKLELSENIEKLFLLHLLDYDRAKILSGSNGSTMIHITKSAMEAKKIFIPKKDEQIIIGNYFQKFDALINQHQQQITKLNNIKQACLSKMFV
ncbi:restriction endonuclease subunit S [Yersinia mollaretii]|uniref:restriction endonuclease subunit S n=1 Tax=Yersinia mollaretii TaxID=33060 RepID=UPI0011A9EE2E|nr:restriction endonuclease subunit S [Yersinia mollaretii]